MTAEERAEVRRETQMECARIAAIESHYWAGVEGEKLQEISIGAIGAAANICAALFMGRNEYEFREEIQKRGRG